MQSREKCPFILSPMHSSENGCYIVCAEEGEEMFQHVYNDLEATFMKNRQFYYEGLGFGKTNNIITSKCELHKNGRIKYSTDIPADSKFISEVITSCENFLDFLEIFLSINEEVSQKAKSINDGDEMYLTYKSMLNLVYSPSTKRLIFLRPLLFHESKSEHYYNIQRFAAFLFSALVGHIQNDEELNAIYGQSFTKKEVDKTLRAKRNYVNCKLILHKKHAILENSFRCSQCIIKKNSCSLANDDHYKTDEQLKNLLRQRRSLEPKSWCYNLISNGKFDGEKVTKITGEHPSNETYKFACVLNVKMPALLFELMDRDVTGHLLFCCPGVFLCEEWYTKLKKFIEKKKTNIAERNHFIVSSFLQNANNFN